MPRKPNWRSRLPGCLAPIPAENLDQIVRDGPLTAEEIETAWRRFKKALIERALGGELTHHLGYSPGGAKPELATNHRNGTNGKTVLTDDGRVAIEVLRDREGTFEPQLIGKHERRFTEFGDKVIALDARGLTVGEIQAFLKDAYAVEVSPDLISAVTGAVAAEVTAWQSPPLEPLYPVVFFDTLRVKIRDETTVRIKAVYLALAVLPDGSRDLLGIWIAQTEGAKLRRRTAQCARRVRAWGRGPARSDDRGRMAPSLDTRDSVLRLFPGDSAPHLHDQRARERARAAFAKSSRRAGMNDDAATKLIWLTLRNSTATWARAAPAWHQAMNQFAIFYGDRFIPPTT